MPGDVGAVATLLNTVASWFLSEDGYAEFAKKRELAKLKKECQDALARNDWPALAAATKRLRDAATKP